MLFKYSSNIVKDEYLNNVVIIITILILYISPTPNCNISLDYTIVVQYICISQKQYLLKWLESVFGFSMQFALKQKVFVLLNYIAKSTNLRGCFKILKK